MTLLKAIFYPITFARKTFSESETFSLFWLLQKIKLNNSVSKLDEAVGRKSHNIKAVNPVASAETDEAVSPPDGLSAVFVTIAQVIPDLVIKVMNRIRIRIPTVGRR